MPKFKYFDLELVSPTFDDDLMQVLFELEHLRKRKLVGTTHPAIFFQLKEVFHVLESVGSARIEGNNTTVENYVEARLEGVASKSEKIKEIENIESGMRFIEEGMSNGKCITEGFILELHKIVVDGLAPAPDGEGDSTPGEMRRIELKITQSEHSPPPPHLVGGYMTDLLDFINKNDAHRYDLIKVAIAHHRFAWIHPFRNGNGRVVRLLTYAQLIKCGFRVDNGKILNPAAVFCINRDRYYDELSNADSGTREGVLLWCSYVLEGLLSEIEKIDKLANHEYLTKAVIIPAIDNCVKNFAMTNIDAIILKRALEIDGCEIKAGDISDLLEGKTPQTVSRKLREMKDSGLIMPISEGARKYVISFSNNALLRGIMRALKDEGFIGMDDDF